MVVNRPLCYLVSLTSCFSLICILLSRWLAGLFFQGTSYNLIILDIDNNVKTHHINKPSPLTSYIVHASCSHCTRLVSAAKSGAS
jgi:hypothetical protein